MQGNGAKDGSTPQQGSASSIRQKTGPGSIGALHDDADQPVISLIVPVVMPQLTISFHPTLSKTADSAESSALLGST